MKVIDLLNKKANGEELPSEINCYNQAFYLSDGIYIAKNQTGKYFEDYFDFSSLDYEIEIIEDTPKEDKKIEKLDLTFEDKFIKENFKSGGISYLDTYATLKMIYNKQCEIIDKINGE